jgi:hypothetical protein
MARSDVRELSRVRCDAGGGEPVSPPLGSPPAAAAAAAAVAGAAEPWGGDGGPGGPGGRAVASAAAPAARKLVVVFNRGDRITAGAPAGAAASPPSSLPSPARRSMARTAEWRPGGPSGTVNFGVLRCGGAPLHDFSLPSGARGAVALPASLGDARLDPTAAPPPGDAKLASTSPSSSTDANRRSPRVAVGGSAVARMSRLDSVAHRANAALRGDAAPSRPLLAAGAASGTGSRVRARGEAARSPRGDAGRALRAAASSDASDGGMGSGADAAPAPNAEPLA